MKAAYDGDTNSTVWDERGYSKAVNDPEENGRLSQDHVVTVEDGKVTGARLDPLPTPPEVWMQRIQSRADQELQRGVTVTIDGTDYGIRTGPVAMALEVGGTVAAERARAKGEKLSEPVPTDRGVADFDVDGLDAIFEAVRAHRRAVVERVRELEGMVADGTMTEDELGKWP